MSGADITARDLVISVTDEIDEAIKLLGEIAALSGGDPADFYRRVGGLLGCLSSARTTAGRALTEMTADDEAVRQ